MARRRLEYLGRRSDTDLRVGPAEISRIGNKTTQSAEFITRRQRVGVSGPNPQPRCGNISAVTMWAITGSGNKTSLHAAHANTFSAAQPAPAANGWHRLEHRPTHEDGDGTGQDSPSTLCCCQTDSSPRRNLEKSTKISLIYTITKRTPGRIPPGLACRPPLDRSDGTRAITGCGRLWITLKGYYHNSVGQLL